MASPDAVNATLLPALGGNVLGSANLVPNPLPLQAYADTNGVLLCATAMTSLVDVNATPLPVLGGNVPGLPNLVPNPLPLQGYADTNGVVRCAIATYCAAGAPPTE